jgi:exosortase/archaeosortase family protein
MERYYKNLIIRFLVILVISLNFIWFYVVLTPITIYLSYLLVGLFYSVVLVGDSLGINGIGFKFVEACVAGAAYYLLLLLVIGLKDISWIRRAKMFLLGGLLLLAVNLLRVFILIVLDLELGKNYFDAVHLIFWNFVSAIAVVLIWIFLVKKFKIESIPFVSDIKYFYERSLLKKRKKS